jgi:hypothetical protein
MALCARHTACHPHQGHVNITRNSAALLHNYIKNINSSMLHCDFIVNLNINRDWKQQQKKRGKGQLSFQIFTILHAPYILQYE